MKVTLGSALVSSLTLTLAVPAAHPDTDRRCQNAAEHSTRRQFQLLFRKQPAQILPRKY